ncbi:MAG TPA: TPM domain-containing protein [Patescibacteria group bacterium]|nr:TPM domain-containing protein [Patescibacteria group bacterium]
MKSRYLFRLALAGTLIILAFAAAAAGDTGTAIPAPPQRWLTDTAGLLSPQVAAQLDARLQQYEQSSGHQIVVYIGRTTGVVPIEDWAVKVFESWRIGRKGLDDGLALFVMADDQRIRIEVGYGLEGQVPDAIASRIINDDMVPRLQQGDSEGAVTKALDSLFAVLSGDGDTAAGGDGQAQPRPAPKLTWFQKILIGIGILGFLLLLITNPSLAIYLLFSILSGGRGGGGGGGFSGGGGRSGGGGASGSW